MAFIRSYAAQGDPIARTHMRAGRIVLPRPFVRPRVGPGFTHGNRFVIPSHVGGFKRRDGLAGDPFLGKLFKKVGKALKKVTLKGVVKGVANVAKIAAPLVLPGIGGLVAGAFLNRGGPTSEAPPTEPVYEAAPAAQSFDPAMLRAMIEQYMQEQYAAQQLAEMQAIQQYQQMAAMRQPGFYYGGF